MVHDWGVEKFREVLADLSAVPARAAAPASRSPASDLHLGWHAQGDGKWFYGVSVENGRIKDDGDFRLRTALRTIVRTFRPRVRLTPMQDVLLCDLPISAEADIETTLTDHGVRGRTISSSMRRHSMACPAIPTCGLAISEAERALPGIIDEFEDELKRLGLEDENIGVRMTGCPNGCVRPYQSDIGIVGRSRRQVHALRRRQPDRFAAELPAEGPGAERRDRADADAAARKLRENERQDEGFGDYCMRLGEAETRSRVGAEAVVDILTHIAPGLPGSRLERQGS